MEKEIAQLEVNKKNSTAVQAALEAVSSKFQDQHDLISKLQASNASLAERVASLELKLNLLLAKAAGHGPTVK